MAPGPGLLFSCASDSPRTTFEAGRTRASRPSSARSDNRGPDQFTAHASSRTDRMMGTDIPLQIPCASTRPPPNMGPASNVFVPPSPRGMEKFMQLYYAEDENEGDDSSSNSVRVLCHCLPFALTQKAPLLSPRFNWARRLRRSYAPLDAISGASAGNRVRDRLAKSRRLSRLYVPCTIGREFAR